MNYALTLAVDRLLDTERIRCAMENQLRALTKPVHIPSTGQVIDKAGEGTPAAAALEEAVAAFKDIEKDDVKEVRERTKETALGPWIDATTGVDHKSVGILLGLIGDPANRVDPATGEVTPRSLSQLRSYCGLGDAKRQRRQKGLRSNWNPLARAVVIARIAKAARNPDGPYRDIYLATREHYADAVHDEPCARCGPSGKPAPEGSKLSAAHQDARALRAVGKAFLKDLWNEARRVQIAFDAQRSHDPPGELAKAA